MTFEPKIVGFLCNWCCYAGADLAGVSRFQYPSNLRVVRVMCSGRIDMHILIEMFIQGADGVFVGGCHLGDCHYLTGNYQAEKKIKLTKKLMEHAGMEPERLRLEWVSAAEGQRFAEVMKDFTEQVRSMGPSPLAGDTPDMNMLETMYIAKNISQDFRLKLLVSKERGLTEEGNVYDKKLSQEEFDALVDGAIDDEFTRCEIIMAIIGRAISAKGIARLIHSSPQKVLHHIVTLRDRGLVELDRIEGTSPLYIAKEVTHNE